MKKIIELLEEINPEEDFLSSENIIEDGLIDSFDLMVLVSNIEKEYGISIKGVDILPQNFMSASTIEELLKSYGVNV